MTKSGYKFLFFGIAGLFSMIITRGQADTTRKRTVEVTSTFKPVLHQTAKINMNATPPTEDTTKPKLQYTLPDQNLLFDYQPGNLKPLAMNIDTGGRWDNNSYIKAGFGSQRTPYLQTGISFGDGKTAGMNIYAKHVASQGKKDFQDFSHTDVGLDGFFQTSKNLEWNALVGMRSDQTYKYGYQPDSLSFPTDSLKQRFQTWIGRVSFHNIKPTSFGISYAPEARVHVFTDNHKNSESNTYLNLPLEKTVGKTFAVDLGLTFDLTRYKPDGKVALNNTAYWISPAVLYRTPTVNIQAGFRPTWDNKSPKIYPNITIEAGTADKRFNFIAGWIGYLRKTTYEYLASFNPWIWAPANMKNTGIEERYIGFKGSVDDHFSYSTKVGFNKITNQPLFVNDSADGKSFIVLNESQMKVLHYDGEVGYTVQEKFSLRGGFSFNHYMNLKDNPKAYGLLPLELNASMRVQIVKDLYLTSDLFGWGGAQYRKQNGDNAQQKGAVDLNAGVDFQITKNLKVWSQFNNLFNQQYQRWNQYPVYGFNFVAGVIFAFDQKN
ncbi:MAG TPA: hypothetical protein VK588_15610 [Chitinophagaceae bacterium]|nr:hypothetical protein [Chitinophagaceae bacterium]